VQFELHFLAPEDEDSIDYPQEALDMSCRVLDTLSALTTAVEDRRNAGQYLIGHHDMSLSELQVSRRQNALQCPPLCANILETQRIVLFSLYSPSRCSKTYQKKDPQPHQEFLVKTLAVSMFKSQVDYELNQPIPESGVLLSPSEWMTFIVDGC